MVTPPTTSSVVTWLAPARQTRLLSSWLSSWSRVRPLSEGRPYSTVTFAPSRVAVTVSRGARSRWAGRWAGGAVGAAGAVPCANAEAAAKARMAVRASVFIDPPREASRERLLEQLAHELRVGFAPRLAHHLSHEPAEGGGLAPTVVGGLGGIGRHHFRHQRAQRALVGELGQALALH